MAKKRAFVKYTKKGKIIPGSLIVTTVGSYPIDGLYVEVPTNICCDTDIPGIITSSPKGWVRYTKTGQIVPGSLIVGKSYPKDGVWKEVVIDTCCPVVPPISSIIIQDPSGSSDGNFVSFNSGAIYVGQTFTLTETGSLQNIILGLIKNTSPVFNIQLVIYEVIGGLPTNTIMGTSSKVAASSITNLIGETSTFTFTNIILPAGQYLFIAKYVDLITHDNTNHIEFKADTTGSYSGGEMGYTLTADSGSTWDSSSIPTWDMLSQIN